jgi:anti-sigma regulatory factor (Ser/Thr protein kinase)
VRSATSTFRGQPSSVPSARRWVVATLVEWGLDTTSWTAAQVVSELATNCTLHARSDFTVRLVLDAACVRLETEDGSPAPLQARAYSATSTTGRGLGIVDGLAVEWGVASHTDGKTVWALLAVDAADLSASDDDAAARPTPAATRSSSAPGNAPVALAGRGAAA